MTDTVSKEQRSRNMSLIRGKDTAPEIRLRKALHSIGFRFRKNVKTLPGKPDIVLPKYHTVIFVHGCFWHQHKGCRRATRPKTNLTYWLPKLKRNVQRDKLNLRGLKAHGWSVLTVWECQISTEELTAQTVRKLDKRLTD